MNTEVINIEKNDQNCYIIAGEVIKKGGLVAFPTETVYGLGGDALNPASSEKIYNAKGRPSDNPLIVHIARIQDVYNIAENISDKAKRLMDKFWPGPLTIIYNKKEIVPYKTTGGLDTVAVRMPENKQALKFIEASGGYIAAPSANSSGRPSPTSAKHVYDDLNGKIELILDGGESGIGVESTIIDMSGKVPMLLRPGFINLDMLREEIGEVLVDPAILGPTKEGKRPKAPGMMYKHYAPKGELYIVRGDVMNVASYINKEVEKGQNNGERIGIITTKENESYYSGGIIKCVGSRKDEITISRHLFSVLREFDDLGAVRIYSEELNTPMMGMAVMNRLLKAAAQRVIDV